MSQKKLKVIWAIDPFTEEDKALQTSYEFLVGLGKANELDVIPTFILGSRLIHWVGNVTPSQLEHVYPAIKERVEKKLENFPEVQGNEPIVILNNEVSIRSDVGKFKEFVDEQKADLVVMSTHGREGLERVRLGSFAENFMLMSETPTFYISPLIDMKNESGSVVVPVDFSKASLNAFKDFLARGLSWGKKLILYSKIVPPHPIFTYESLAVTGYGWDEAGAYVEKENEYRKAEGERLVAMGKEQGYEVELIIDESKNDVEKSILELVKSRKADGIVMGSSKGRVSTIVVGSMARQLVRHSPVPVLVSHYNED